MVTMDDVNSTMAYVDRLRMLMLDTIDPKNDADLKINNLCKDKLIAWINGIEFVGRIEFTQEPTDAE